MLNYIRIINEKIFIEIGIRANQSVRVLEPQFLTPSKGEKKAFEIERDKN